MSLSLFLNLCVSSYICRKSSTTAHHHHHHHHTIARQEHQLAQQRNTEIDGDMNIPIEIAKSNQAITISYIHQCIWLHRNV